MQPLPVDTEIVVYDTLELLRPNLVIYSSLEEASAAVTELEAKVLFSCKMDDG